MANEFLAALTCPEKTAPETAVPILNRVAPASFGDPSITI